MIEMTTNRTDHSSEIAPYAALGSTCDATAKYANVKRPVDAIPTERIRAPRAWPRAAAADAAPVGPDGGVAAEAVAVPATGCASRGGRGAWSTGTASAPRRPGRAATAATRRSAWTSG